MAVPLVVRILERLAREPTGPFHEQRVIREARAIAAEFGANARADPHGNLIVAPPGERSGPPVWLVAHLDHPAFESRGAGEATFLGGVGLPYFRRGVRLRFFVDDREVTATLGRVVRTKRPFRVRIEGEDARRIRRGALGVWEVQDFRLRDGRVHARQLDDLAGSSVSLAAVSEACRSRTTNLRALLTRAEEVGFVGTLAAAATHEIPRGAWIINAEASKAIPGVEIGGGPVIRVGDRTRTFDPRAENLLAVARMRLPETKPVQRALMVGGTCEATPWTLLGYRATGVAIPLGNYHNQGPAARVLPEVVAVNDLNTAVELVGLAAKSVPAARKRDAKLRDRIWRYYEQNGDRLRATRP